VEGIVGHEPPVARELRRLLRLRLRLLLPERLITVEWSVGHKPSVAQELQRLLRLQLKL
jgi:hypothetical protein